MTYTERGDRITIEMTAADFDELLLVLGYAAGAASKDGQQAFFWRCLRLANNLNQGNANFMPYQIPEEFAGKAPLT
jgi:hypothetical protein